LLIFLAPLGPLILFQLFPLPIKKHNFFIGYKNEVFISKAVCQVFFKTFLLAKGNISKATNPIKNYVFYRLEMESQKPFFLKWYQLFSDYGDQ
jgi:hypothetical protein